MSINIANSVLIEIGKTNSPCSPKSHLSLSYVVSIYNVNYLLEGYVLAEKHHLMIGRGKIVSVVLSNFVVGELLPLFKSYHIQRRNKYILLDVLLCSIAE